LIFVTGPLSEESLAITVQNGAADCVQKDNPVCIPGAVVRALERAEQRRLLVHAEMRVARLGAIRDVMSAIDHAIVRHRGRNALFQEACRIATEIGKFPIAAIISRKDPAANFAVDAWAGLPLESTFEDWLTSLSPELEGSPGTLLDAVRKNTAFVVNDLSDDLSIGKRRELWDAGVRSQGAFPLTVAGNAIGAMVIATGELGFFTDEEIRLLSDVAGNLSFALDFINEQHRVVRLSRIRDVLSAVSEPILRPTDGSSLYESVCRIVFEVAGYVSVFVVSVEGGEANLRIASSAGWSRDVPALERLLKSNLENRRGVVWAALHYAKPSVINDLDAVSGAARAAFGTSRDEGVRAIGAFPLVVDARCVGAMVFSTEEAGYFDDEEIALLSNLANNVSFALNNLGQQERVARLSRIRAVLSAVNEAIVRVTDAERLYHEVCRIALEIAGYVNVFAVAVDDDKHALRVVAAVGKWSAQVPELERMLAVNLKIGRGLMSQALNEAKPAVGNDVRGSSPLRRVQRELLDDEVRAVGVFPLLVDGHCVGAMAFDSAEAGYFDEEEISLLTDLTNNFSFALSHLARQERIDRMSRIRDILSAVNVAIVRLRDRSELYQEVCRIAVELGGFSNAMVVELDLKSGRVELRFSCGRSDRATLLEALQWSALGVEPGIIEVSLRTLRPAVKNDVQRSESWPLLERLLKGEIRAVGSFPIVVDGRATGAMVLEARSRGYFDAQEIELLTNLTNDLAFGLSLLEKRQRVDYLSFYDAMTRLPNRTLFYDRLGRDIAAAKKAGKGLALAIIDISRFSVLNNTLGEYVGDEALREIASRLRGSFEEHSIARVGGDKFALCLPIDDLSALSAVITDEGIKIFDAPLRIGHRELRITARAGCAVFPADGADPQELFQNAEAALLNAKSSGATYRFYAPELNVRMAKQLDLEARLQRAIEERQFVLFYQPKVEVVGRTIVGFEGLIRWQDPARGVVLPGDFIALLERTGMIIPVGRWALLEAVRQYEEWRRAGLRPPRIAINLSAVQLRQDRLVDDVRTAVEGFEEECGLDLEVTESMLLGDFEDAIEKLKAIKALGPRLSLDDFGTGYSSLSYIHRLPLSALKIDRSFISGMFDDANKRSIVSTIVSLGEALELTVIAEGVETEAEARLLQLLRCGQFQGHLFSVPLPADQAARLLL
jgi:diguanylate cyclase (GGDEF)-like protein